MLTCEGSLVMTWQLFDAFGLFLGFTANLAVSQTGSSLALPLTFMVLANGADQAAMHGVGRSHAR